MKLGEIKIEALKLMFVNNTNEMNIESFTNLMNDENYASYLVNMRGAINRALDRIKNARVLQLKSTKLDLTAAEISKHYIRYDLPANIKDFYMLERVVFEDEEGGYEDDTEYQTEGGVIVLPNIPGEYRILYHQNIDYVFSDMADTDELPIPDDIARLIPYFIKGDLYQEDEPNLAADARNTFEACLQDIKIQHQGHTNNMVMKYTENN